MLRRTAISRDFLSGLSAATWALQTVRAAVLEQATWSEGAPALLLLLAMGVVYAVIAMIALRWAMRSVRRSGGLSQY